MKYFTPQEEDMIDLYRRENVEEGCEFCNFCSVDTLLQPWLDAKSEFLLPLFGDQLILKRQIDVKLPDNLVMKKIRDEFYDNPKVSKFYQELCTAMWNARYENKLDAKDYFDIRDIYENARYMAANRFGSAEHKRKFAIEKDGTIYRFEEGQRMMKVLGILSEIFNIDSYHDMTVVHSQILNTSRLKGTFCLSIHPLDYMTMSDNDCDWSSCMSWREGGEYRQGTVEMMNSPCIVVGYLESASTKFKIGENAWNSKRYRSLYFVNKELITNIKGYPYKSLDIDKVAVEWLKELAQENMNILFADELIDFNSPKNSYYLNLNTDHMYNDTVSRKDAEGKTYHIGYILPSSVELRTYIYNYSGFNECMVCGSIDEIGWERSLSCQNCNQYITCAECGYEYSESEMEKVDDEWLCQYCYDSATIEDFFTGEIHLVRNSFQIRVGIKVTGGWFGDFLSFDDSFDFYIGNEESRLNVEEKLKEWIKPEVLAAKPSWVRCGNDYEVHYNALTVEGIETFFPGMTEDEYLDKFRRMEENRNAN